MHAKCPKNGSKSTFKLRNHFPEPPRTFPLHFRAISLNLGKSCSKKKFVPMKVDTYHTKTLISAKTKHYENKKNQPHFPLLFPKFCKVLYLAFLPAKILEM